MIAEDFECDSINIWVQIHGLPYELRSFHRAKGLAEHVGKVKEGNSLQPVETHQLGGEYVRFRIAMDITKPILPGFFLERMVRKHIWVPLKYVKLPNVLSQLWTF